jgi:hypothetical protein
MEDVNMKIITGTGVLAALLLLTTPTWASTYYGGFEDTTGTGSDYDYNDLVFSITGVTLNSSSSFYAYSASDLLTNLYSSTGLAPGAGNGTGGSATGSPFWNRTSNDGAYDNIGYCMYGGPSGACDGLAAINPGALYLATASNGAATDVTFTDTAASGTLVISITADTDGLAWECLSVAGCGGGITDGTITDIITASSQDTLVDQAFSITAPPGSVFALVGIVNGSTSSAYSSDDGGSVSQFAFFEPAAISTVIPEPASLALLGTGLLTIGFWSRKRRRS